MVEDDAVIGFLLSEMLTDMGHRVDAVVTTEAAAIEADGRYSPDFILIDENLSSGYGSSAIAQILARRRVPYVLMGGALSDAGERNVAILNKPFFATDLRQAIARALQIAA